MSTDADLFADALEQLPGERAAFLARHCRDAEQRTRIEALLQSHEMAEVVLAAPLNQRPVEPRSEAGTTIGRFKLLEKIGEGGCGTVWMAWQEAPVRRRVALKVIKLGMDTSEVIARFEAERQALAMMDHPYIAKIFEAGATDSGRPYFAMELVHGHPITRYCDARQLTTEQRLRLFVLVCDAIQHAHEKGVIHRDIKPSNILVTHEDGEPVPRVIDFGIAKATQGRLTDRTLFTAFEQFVGTPAYMSPEQADLSAREVDTRSDVYSLGALLYELVSGQPPFDPKTLTAAGIDEVRRIIRDVDPPRPSTRLGSLSGEERDTLAQRRGMVPAQHAMVIKGDLDWIAMKALDKRRARRYDSASELAMDVRRHLEHRPVVARPPSPAYILQKFLQRRRLPVLAAAAVVCALAAGTLMSLWQARRARRAEQESARMAEKQRAPVLGAVFKKTAPPAATAPASAESLARAREFVVDLQTNFFGDCAFASREDWIEARAQQAVDAFDRVMPATRDAAWKRERLWSMARIALAQRRQANANANVQAELVLREMDESISAGDTSDEAALLLATACLVAYEPIVTQRVYGPHPDAPKRAASLQRAEVVLQPLLDSSEAPRARQLYAEVLLARASWNADEAALGLAQQARTLIDGLDFPALRLTHARILAQLGRYSAAADNVRLQQEAIGIADALLAHAPGSPSALRVKFWAYWALSEVSHARHDNVSELAQLTTLDQIAAALESNDPSSDDDWYAVLMARRALAAALVELGRISEALAVLRQTAADGGHPPTQPLPVEGGSRRYIKGTLERIATLEAERGDFAAADQAMAAWQLYVASLKVPAGASARAALSRDRVAATRIERQITLFRGAYESARESAQRTLAQLTTLLTGSNASEADRAAYYGEVMALREQYAEALVQNGLWTEAENMFKATAQLQPRNMPVYTLRQRIWLATALARLGRSADSLEMLAPVVDVLKPRQENLTASVEERQLFGLALVIKALDEPDSDLGRKRSAEALAEAQSIFDGMTIEVRQLYASRLLARWIAQAVK